MKITLGNTLPPYPDFVEGIRRTHDRGYTLVPVQAKLSPAVTSTTCRLPFPMIFYKVMDNLEPILAIELMNAAQGLGTVGTGQRNELAQRSHLTVGHAHKGIVQ